MMLEKLLETPIGHKKQNQSPSCPAIQIC